MIQKSGILGALSIVLCQLALAQPPVEKPRSDRDKPDPTVNPMPQKHLSKYSADELAAVHDEDQILILSDATESLPLDGSRYFTLGNESRSFDVDDKGYAHDGVAKHCGLDLDYEKFLANADRDGTSKKTLVLLEADDDKDKDDNQAARLFRMSGAGKLVINKEKTQAVFTYPVEDSMGIVKAVSCRYDQEKLKLTQGDFLALVQKKTKSFETEIETATLLETFNTSALTYYKKNPDGKRSTYSEGKSVPQLIDHTRRMI